MSPAKSPSSFLWRACRRRPHPLIAVALSALFVVLLESLLPLIAKNAIDIATHQSDPNGLSNLFGPGSVLSSAATSTISLGGADAASALTVVITVYLLVATLRFIFQALRRFYSGKLSIDVQHDLRIKLLSSLQKLDGPAQDRIRTGQVVSRSISDLQGIAGLLAMLPLTLGSVVKLIITVAIMIGLSIPLTVVGLSVVPLIVFIALKSRGILHAATWAAQQKAADIAAHVEETVTGVRVVKAFAQEENESRKLQELSSELFGLRLRAAKLSARFQPTLQTLPQLSLVANIAIGGWLALEGRITIGTFVAFATYLTSLTTLSRLVANMVISLQLTSASIERVADVISTQPDSPEPKNSCQIPEGPVGIEFRDVSHYRDSRPLLNDVSFTAAPGTTLALIGPPGAGKTIVTELIGRHYLADKGSIHIYSGAKSSAHSNGKSSVELSDINGKCLYQAVTIVPEEPYLFNGTIRDNIAFAKPNATDEEIQKAADDAQVTFIDQLNDGWNTVIGERGHTLSGGQRQRVALARALLANPRILVLDDSTSAVDAITEAKIFEAIARRARKTLGKHSPLTVIVVAHRSSTLELSDHIVILENGEVTGQGSKEELAAHHPRFAELMDFEPVTEGEAEKLQLDTPGAPEPDDSLLWPAPDYSPESRIVNTNMERGPLAPGGPRQPGGGRGGMGAAMLNAPASAELLSRIADLPPANEKPNLPAAALCDQSEPRSGNSQGGAIDDRRTSHSREKSASQNFSLRSLLRHVRWLFVTVIGLLAINAVADLAFPMLVRSAVDKGIESNNLRALWLAAGAGLLVVLIGWVAVSLNTVITARTGERLLFLLRVRSYRHLQKLGVSYFDYERSGRIMTRMTTDIDALSTFLQTGAAQGFIAMFTLLGVIVLLLSTNLLLATVALASVPVIAIGTAFFRRISARLYKAAREQLATVNADFQENIAGLREAQMYHRVESTLDKFTEESRSYQELRYRAQTAVALFFPGINFIAELATAGVLAVGARQVSLHQTSPGTLVAFTLYLGMLFGPIQQLSQVFDGYQQAKVGLDRIRDLLTTPPMPDFGKSTNAREAATGRISLDDVTFYYETEHGHQTSNDQPYPQTPAGILEGLNLDINPGETVAIVGATGAGKSTIVKLLARFHDPVTGHVRASGTDIREYPLRQWRKTLGYVPQEAHLFSGTIASNIAYGRPEATQQEITDAARRVGALTTISQIPGGFRHSVGERGRGLSSGQKQLIALARAEMMRPELLLLDEATATLDPMTESTIIEATDRASHSRTAILVAHRLATAARADRILVMEHGKIVENGNHFELLKRDGIYKQLWDKYHKGSVAVE